MGSTLHHLQQWCSELIQQALSEFRQETDRTMRQQCETLQIEQQRLARKHNEIVALADRLVAQRQSSDDLFASRAASLERRACDLDAFLDELAREQANHVRSLEEFRTDIAQVKGERFDSLKVELSAISKGAQQIQQDVNVELQGMAKRFEARLLELSQHVDGQERVMAESTESCRSWFHAVQEGASRQYGDAQGQLQDVVRHLKSQSDTLKTQGETQDRWGMQLRDYQSQVTQHLQQFSHMLERVYHCCMAFQDALGKDREKAESTLSQLVNAMDNIRQYTNKYADTFGHNSSQSTAFVSPPYSFQGSDDSRDRCNAEYGRSSLESSRDAALQQEPVTLQQEHVTASQRWRPRS